MTVWKIQRPLNVGPSLPILAYPEGRSPKVFIDSVAFLTQAMREELQRKGKIYVEGLIVDGPTAPALTDDAKMLQEWPSW